MMSFTVSSYTGHLGPSLCCSSVVNCSCASRRRLLGDVCTLSSRGAGSGLPTEATAAGPKPAGGPAYRLLVLACANDERLVAERAYHGASFAL